MKQSKNAPTREKTLMLRIVQRTKLARQVGLLSVFTGALLGCDKEAPKEAEKVQEVAPAKPEVKEIPTEINDALLGAFRPSLPKEFVSEDHPITPEKIELGRMLYFETRMSKNHDLSCNSCHGLDTYGVDGERVSAGHKKQTGSRNSPTVYNSAGHFAQFWDGRSPDVEDQATGPIVNPLEMGMPDDVGVKTVLSTIPEYVKAFAAAFPDDKDPVTLKNAGRAIGAFERRLVTPAPWDAFLDGDKKALSDEQKKGFNIFMNQGCMACHSGTLVGGNSFQKLGAVQPWPNQKDQGRFEVTKKEQDKMMFKVPSLRNVAETAPYFHDGSVATLEEAIVLMGRHQLAREISKEDVQAIAAWLKSLTGKLPSPEYITAPELPPSGPKTPKPDPN